MKNTRVLRNKYIELESLLKLLQPTDEIMEVQIGDRILYILKRHELYMAIGKDNYNSLSVKPIDSEIINIYNYISSIFPQKWDEYKLFIPDDDDIIKKDSDANTTTLQNLFNNDTESDDDDMFEKDSDAKNTIEQSLIDFNTYTERDDNLYDDEQYSDGHEVEDVSKYLSNINQQSRYSNIYPVIDEN